MARSMGHCQHCHEWRWIQARLLCRLCHDKAEIRERYGRIADTWKPAVDIVPQILPLPTDAAPGTREKILELAARLEKGLRLWHPDDARDEGTGQKTWQLSPADYLALMSWINPDGSVGCSLPPNRTKEVNGTGGRNCKRPTVVARQA